MVNGKKMAGVASEPWARCSPLQRRETSVSCSRAFGGAARRGGGCGGSGAAESPHFHKRAAVHELSSGGAAHERPILRRIRRPLRFRFERAGHAQGVLNPIRQAHSVVHRRNSPRGGWQLELSGSEECFPQAPCGEVQTQNSPQGEQIMCVGHAVSNRHTQVRSDARGKRQLEHKDLLVRRGALQTRDGCTQNSHGGKGHEAGSDEEKGMQKGVT
jgi:hypothetical protein